MVITTLSSSNIRLLNWTVKFYKFIGLAPVSVNINPIVHQNKTQISVNFTSSSSTIFTNFIGHFILLPTGLWNLYQSLSNGPPEGWKPRDHFIHNFTGINVVLIQISFILIFSLRHKKIAEILNKLLAFESKFSDLKPNSGQCWQLIIFMGYVLVLFIMCLGRLTNSGADDKIGMIIAVFAKFAVRNLLIQYSIILVFLENKYYSLNESLVLANDQFYFNLDLEENSKRNLNDCELLIFMRKAYFNLGEITNCIAEFYSVPVLISLGYFCMTTAYSADLMINSIIGYMTGDSSYGMREISGYFFIFLLCVYPTFCLTTSVTSVLKEAKKMKNLIHKTHSSQGRVKYELEQFSMELLHQNISFTAFDIVSLDNRLLLSVFSAVISWIVLSF